MPPRDRNGFSSPRSMLPLKEPRTKTVSAVTTRPLICSVPLPPKPTRERQLPEAEKEPIKTSSAPCATNFWLSHSNCSEKVPPRIKLPFRAVPRKRTSSLPTPPPERRKSTCPVILNLPTKASDKPCETRLTPPIDAEPAKLPPRKREPSCETSRSLTKSSDEPTKGKNQLTC